MKSNASIEETGKEATRLRSFSSYVYVYTSCICGGRKMTVWIDRHYTTNTVSMHGFAHW